MTSEEKLISEIKELKQRQGAVIMAHYYQRPEIQAIADYVGDSLALARLAAKTDARMIVMCGVHFMGETAKILCPDKSLWSRAVRRRDARWPTAAMPGLSAISSSRTRAIP